MMCLKDLQLEISNIVIAEKVDEVVEPTDEKVQVTVAGESAEGTLILKASRDDTWASEDFTSCVAIKGGKISINGTNVSNPDGATYRYISLTIALPENLIDVSKTYTISYKLTATAMTLGGGAVRTEFLVGGQGVSQDIAISSSQEISGTAKIENGQLYIFHEVNQLLLKDLQLEISDIVITVA